MPVMHEHGGNVFAVARSLGVAPEEVLDFSASINPLGMAPGVREALASCVDRLMHYPDKGAAELKFALADYHDLAADEVAVGNGSTELIHLLPRAFPGGKGLIVAPAFAEYASALERAGWEIDYFTLKAEDGFLLSLSAMKEKLQTARYDMLFVCNPGNPTGALIPYADVKRIVDICQERGVFLVLDEAFADFCEEDSAKHLIRKSARSVLLRSMTKFFAIPGLRLGYAIAARETVAAIAELQDPWSVNTAAQVAGVASLQDPEYCRQTREYVREERERMTALLTKLCPLTIFPSHANYLLAEISSTMTSAELRARLVEKGVLIRDCSNFQGLDGRFFRIAVRLQAENNRIIDQLAAAFKP